MILKQLDILIQLAEADKHFAQVERELIFSIAGKRNVPEEEVRQLIKNPQPIEELEDLTFDQKFDYLMTSIELVFADHKIFEREIEFCKNIATKLGFNKSIIDVFILRYEQSPGSDFRQIASEYFEKSS